MKKVFAVVFVVLFFCSAVAPVWAGGDKVRGEKGQGATNQVDADSQGNQS